MTPSQFDRLLRWTLKGLIVLGIIGSVLFIYWSATGHI